MAGGDAFPQLEVGGEGETGEGLEPWAEPAAEPAVRLEMKRRSPSGMRGGA